ncbi:MAG TPA: helix-turn-helix domain-containing protein [Rhizomicrobium sp.]|nr:helix-turn-helix domain-containing protein [Rhizomicrobium sp.]
MDQDFYTITEVAKRLKLHVKTVLIYVRDGRLKATRIGKQYRVARSDFDAFSRGHAAPAEADDGRRTRHVDVSSIVEIDAISRPTAERTVTHLQGALKGRSPADRPTRLDTIYYEDIARLKLIISASPETTASLLNLIPILIEER